MGTVTWHDMGENEVLDSIDGDFYISFNPHAWAGISLLESDNGGSETALVIDRKFFILNGDHRSAYEKIYDQGKQACLSYFEEHRDQASSWNEK